MTTTTTLPDRPWAADALASVSSASDALASALVSDRLAKLQTLLYSPAFHKQEAQALAGQGFVDANKRLRSDRAIIAKHLQSEYQKSLETETNKMNAELASNKETFVQELAALKPLAMEVVVKNVQNALAKAGGGGGGAQLLFNGTGDGEDEEEGDEDEEEEGIGTAITADVYGLTETPSVGAKRGSGSGGTALVTPGGSGSGAKRMRKAARADKKDELQERLMAALVGGEDGAEGGAEDVAALLGGGGDEAALVSEAIAALNTQTLASKMRAAMAEAQRAMERELSERFSAEVTKATQAAVACAREELRLQFEAQLEEKLAEQAVLQEVEFDMAKKELEEKYKQAAAGGGARVGGAEEAGRGGGGGKMVPVKK